MREGSLEAPVRHPIDWQNPDFADPEKLDAEMRRQLDICHGCRRCFNLCDSFPRLFDLIDAKEEEELDGVPSSAFKDVVDACTLCDMCYLTKCPYVPPHEFDLDIPHLFLRYRYVERQQNGTAFFDKQLTETDRNGKVATKISGLANWGSSCSNHLTRPVLQAAAGIDKRAELPKYAQETLTKWLQTGDAPVRKEDAPASARKAVIYATCFAEYNNTSIGKAALKVLARNGVQSKHVYPECCGMPQLEQGDIERVADKAKRVAQTMKPHIEAGYDVVALTPSCALMLKFEWPLICPDDADVKRLAQATFDVSEYIVDIAKNEGLAEGLKPLEGGVAMHLACHARAQNMGPKGAEMLRQIPDTRVAIVERCSGHGGSWGIKKSNFDVAKKFVGQTVKKANQTKAAYLASECPLAGKHIAQIATFNAQDGEQPFTQATHPVELLALAYGETL